MTTTEQCEFCGGKGRALVAVLDADHDQRVCAECHADPRIPTVAARYVAHFTPQAWIRDYAVTVDAEGPTTWDVTAYLNKLTAEHPDPAWRAEALEGNNYSADELRYDPTAPEWIREWHGPFEVAVEIEGSALNATAGSL